MVPLCYIILYSSEKRFLSCALMPINLLLVLLSKEVLGTLSSNSSTKLGYPVKKKKLGYPVSISINNSYMHVSYRTPQVN